jgi:hypothetical protein
MFGTAFSNMWSARILCFIVSPSGNLLSFPRCISAWMSAATCYKLGAAVAA